MNQWIRSSCRKVFLLKARKEQYRDKTLASTVTMIYLIEIDVISRVRLYRDALQLLTNKEERKEMKWCNRRACQYLKSWKNEINQTNRRIEEAERENNKELQVLRATNLIELQKQKSLFLRRLANCCWSRDCSSLSRWKAPAIINQSSEKCFEISSFLPLSIR